LSVGTELASAVVVDALAKGGGLLGYAFAFGTHRHLGQIGTPP
jgi:hypothetical protein